MTESGFIFRFVRPEDADAVIRMERICFPPNEACSAESMRERVYKAPECFLVCEEKDTGIIAGLINGIATDEAVFSDDLFTDINRHIKDGKNLMITGVETLPEYRGRNIATDMMNEYIRIAKEAGRSALMLTCHEYLIGFYSRFGFIDGGISSSVWGGVVWHDMSKVL